MNGWGMRFISGLTGSAIAIIMLVVGIVQFITGYLGLYHSLGWFWGLVASIIAGMLRLEFPFMIGTYIFFAYALEWPWPVAALIAAPGLLFLVPGVLAAVLSLVRPPRVAPSPEPDVDRWVSPSRVLTEPVPESTGKSALNETASPIQPESTPDPIRSTVSSALAAPIPWRSPEPPVLTAPIPWRSPETPVRYSSPWENRPKPHGIGGLLYVFCFLQLLFSPGVLAAAYGEVADFYKVAPAISQRMPEVVGYVRLVHGLSLAAGLATYVAALCIYCGSRNGRMLGIVATAMTAVTGFILQFSYPATLSGEMRPSVGMLVWACVWLGYFVLSRRVRNTYCLGINHSIRSKPVPGYAAVLLLFGTVVFLAGFIGSLAQLIQGPQPAGVASQAAHSATPRQAASPATPKRREPESPAVNRPSSGTDRPAATASGSLPPRRLTRAPGKDDASATGVTARSSERKAAQPARMPLTPENRAEQYWRSSLNAPIPVLP